MDYEELMKPRWKVIADYPFAPPIHAVGTIIENSLAPDGIDPWENKYPHLFRALKWWQDRVIDDMPKYVKCTGTGGSLVKNSILKIDSWGEFKENEIQRLDDKTAKYFAISRIHNHEQNFDHKLNVAHFIPATETEYNIYEKERLNKTTK